jgi:Fe2+ or Zn2+ uptake regulation protein
MSCTAEYIPQLRSLGFRVTTQRLAILHVLLDSGAHLLPTQVYERARRKTKGLSQPTVYRTLDFLAQNGIVQPALNAQKHVVYQISRHGHHHLLCSSCGRSVEVEHELVDDFYRTLEIRTGYRLTASHLTLFGLCPACRDLNLGEAGNAALSP